MRTHTLFSVLLAVVLISAPLAKASEHRFPRSFLLAQEMSEEQAASRVKNHPEDKILKVEHGRDGDGPFYRIKILGKDGRVQWVTVDKQSGQVRRPPRQ